jgi:hypothetical protein
VLAALLRRWGKEARTALGSNDAGSAAPPSPVQSCLADDFSIERAAYGPCFRFDSKTRIIIFAWVNDENTQRSSGSKSDQYTVFQRMLARGHPPDDWAALMSARQPDGK